MTFIRIEQSSALSRTPLDDPQRRSAPRLSRTVMALAVVGAVGASFAVGDVTASSRAVMNAGDDLTRLLRFMALIKAGLALGAVAAVFWRLGSEISLGRLSVYAAVCAVMVSGPGLIWRMEHVGLGALFLHGGLVALIVLLWRDPTIPVQLQAALVKRGVRPVR